MRKNAFDHVGEGPPPKPDRAAGESATPSYPPHRRGKKALIAYFSPGVSKALRQLALDEDVTMQALLGEAIDLLMRDRGRHPFGER
jgi:hypothetical protein